jgi:hypothetical protein
VNLMDFTDFVKYLDELWAARRTAASCFPVMWRPS